MAVKSERLAPAEHLERRIAELDGEAERVRAEYGDPAEALGAFLRERFGLDALMATYREYRCHEDSFLFDDYAGDEDEGGGEPD